MEEIYISEEEFLRQSLENFHAQFPSEESCLRLFPAVCRACGLNNKDADLKKRSFRCSKCNAKTWRTAGTYFHGLRKLLPTIAWIWLQEDRVVISAHRFSGLFKIAYACAWDIDAKLKKVLEKEMDSHDVFELMSTVFNPVICKRSSQSVAGQHPSYEEEGDELPELENREDFDHDQLTVHSILRPQPIEFDVLYQSSQLAIEKFTAALALLNIEGIATRYQGNKFSLTKSNPMTLVSSQEKHVIHSFFAYVKEFHAFSRKYLQRHLASFWAQYGRNRWSNGTLLKSVMKYARASRAEILAYISPDLVRIPCP